MNRLQGRTIYLDFMEKDEFKEQWCAFEYDMDLKTDVPEIGRTMDRAGERFDDLAKLQGKTLALFGIYTNDGKLVGDTSIYDIDWRNRSAVLGLAIARKADRRKGYATEATGLLLNYAFEVLGLERLYADTLEHNAGSRKTLEKNGLVQEGVKRRSDYIGGRYYDRIEYSILAEEYAGRHGSL